MAREILRRVPRLYSLGVRCRYYCYSVYLLPYSADYSTWKIKTKHWGLNVPWALRLLILVVDRLILDLFGHILFICCFIHSLRMLHKLFWSYLPPTSPRNSFQCCLPPLTLSQLCVLLLLFNNPESNVCCPYAHGGRGIHRSMVNLLGPRP